MIQEIFNRYNYLVGINSDTEICKKMNAEFNATFYCNKGNTFVSYTNEAGKQDIKKLN